MDLDITQLAIGITSGGTVLYLLVEKLFSRKKDKAEAHKELVASFEQEMKAIRQIRLDMIEDVKVMHEKVKQESEESASKITKEVTTLKAQITELKQQMKANDAKAAKRESVYLKQMGSLNETVKGQSEQINRVVDYWRLLCDNDCNTRHVPACPLNDTNG